jgi:hypothetical protein
MVRVLALTLLGLSVLAGAAAGAEDRRSCLHYRDLNGITKVDTETLIAKRKGGGRYEIKVDADCRYLDWPQNYFVTRSSSPSECVRPGDALVLRRGGSCFVQSVTPLDEPTEQ